MSFVSRETSLALAEFAALVRKWNPKINLVANSSLVELETRHIEDSIQITSLASQATGTWVDLGSGGGLPGLVLAITRPDLDVTLVESDQRKSVFLRTVARELGLQNVKVLARRIEEVDRLEAANVSARALAALPLLMAYVERHLAPGGTAWLMKGRNWRSELSEAEKSWKFSYRAHPSKTDPEAVILEIKGIHCG